MSEGTGSDGAGDDAGWESLFGFDEPYDNQADAIEAAIDAGERRGFLAMEGPCGTGKTMAALTAAAHLVRETDHYENVLVVTPVKQQLQQFVADLRTMNAGLDEPLDGVALVGKRDLCPYGREDLFPRDASTHDRCEDLRENTATLVEADEDSASFDGESVDDLTELRPADALEDAWWDPAKARDLARAARADDPTTVDAAALTTAGAESPYVPRQPTAPEELSGDGEDSLYCPFEADWYGRNKGSPVGFDHGEGNVVTVDELLPQAVARGTCPHRAQSVLLESADVIVGNYNHLFDPQSRPLIEGAVDERTFVIVDEAHRIEERVRGLLSDRIGRHTLVRARNDFASLRTRARQSAEGEREIESALRSYDVTLDQLEGAYEFVDDVIAWFDRTVMDHLESEHGTHHDAWPEHDLELPLRDPEVAEPDDLTTWAEDAGHRGSRWRALANVGTAVASILDEEDERNPVCGAVGVTLTNWWERDHATYFREIELEHSPSDLGSTANAWERVYTPALVMYNCMPARQVQQTLAELGGGVLMSATLEPLDVFRAVTGLDALADGEGDADARPVVERSYDLPFPEDNRASWIVDATAFTARNRGEPSADNDNRTRAEYRHVLRSIARSPGNVMICMPNYREAAWAGDYLADVVEKPVLVDASTSNEETEALKHEFFSGDGKALVTSTRGTLTEGVDYDGDKLDACAVVGVPLVNVGSPRVRAVRRAYADAFGESNAFEYALTVPAVRRARQAIGRVIRGPEERGVRALVGNRYVAGAPRSVHGFLAPDERAEFVRMTPEFLAPQLESFWDGA